MSARIARWMITGALAAVAAAASAATPERTLGAFDWRWEWTEYADRTRTVSEDPARYIVRFGERNALRVRADCNSGSGRHVERDDGSMTLSRIATTKKGCGKGSQDREFLKNLADVRAYRFEADLLFLELRDGGAMRFSAAP